MRPSLQLPAAGPFSPSRWWSQVRWRILSLLFLITVINFIDRQTLSVVAPVLLETFHMSNSDYARMVSAFMLGMMIGEFPMGWIMDRWGVRAGFSFAVIWWSIATAMHSVGRSVFQFSLFRFWMGTGECGNFSGAMKVISEWFPERERALAVGIFNSGSMIGAVIAAPCIVFITLHFGWRAAFLLPAVLGFGWALAWRAHYAPLRGHPRVTETERSFIEEGKTSIATPPRNRDLLSKKHVWGLMLCRFFVGPVVQFYLFWTPEYLYRSRGLTLAQIGLFAWVPFLFGDIGSIGGGWVAGLLLRRRFSLNAARFITLYAGALCCLLSAGVVHAATAAIAISFICLVLFGHTFLSANMFAAISDLVPKPAVGRVTGLTGIAGGLSGLLFPLLTGFLIDRFSYAPVFLLAAIMPLLGVVLLQSIVHRIRPAA
jgi:ACS family hexuronate transporter-like MFS transporter